VTRLRRLSAQAEGVLAALLADPTREQHGYELARQTGLSSGTLYPILIRLADRGLVRASWEAGQPAGRPRRHLYLLTEDGLDQARIVVGPAPLEPPAPQRSGPAPRRRPGRRGLAGEGI
jgi:PadR family transcriptional regulator, regulatory protein PadR